MDVDFADAAFAKAMADIEQQGAGTAGKVEDVVEVVALAGGGFLAVEGDDAGEDARNLLGGVELACFFVGTGGKLTDQVLVGIAEGVAVGGKFGESFGDRYDDGAEFGIAGGVVFAQFFGVEVNFRKKAAKGTGKGFVFDVAEAALQGTE